jgi:hypothetical protein
MNAAPAAAAADPAADAVAHHRPHEDLQVLVTGSDTLYRKKKGGLRNR